MLLRIRRAELFLARIPLRFSVKHSLANRTANTTGFLVLTDEDGNVGLGEFLSREYVTGETTEACVTVLKQLGPLITSTAIGEPIVFIESLWTQFDDRPGRFGAICAIDLALLDLWGKHQGRPVAALLKPDKLRTERRIVYSAAYPFANGLKLSGLHFFFRTLKRMEHIKVKGTGRIEKDLAYVNAIRKAYPYRVRIRLDLNGSLRSEDAEVYFLLMLDSGADWFEQPFPKSDWETSRHFQQKFGSRITLCADESVCSPQELEQAIREGAFRAINIRIAKNGGLLAALRMYDRAVDAGLDVQLGALVGESSVLSFAGLHFAAIANGLRHCEGCFGNFLIKWDVLRPSLTFSRRGHVPLTRLPEAGLVPTIDLRRLRRYAFHHVDLGSA